MSNPNDNIQIISFTTNDISLNTNNILKILLEKYNHIIINESRHAMSFDIEFPNSVNPTNIMICCLTDLSKEYSGITDVNFYMIFIDLQNEKTKESLESIISYARKYCDLSKKIYVLGVINNGKEAKFIHKEDIKDAMKSGNFIYEYIKIFLEKKNDVADSLLNIFINFYKESANKKEYLKSHIQAHSCNVF